jgi:hypothetical protein
MISSVAKDRCEPAE